MADAVEPKVAQAHDGRDPDEKHDILYVEPNSSTDGVDTKEKTAATARDGSIDAESAGLFHVFLSSISLVVWP